MQPPVSGLQPRPSTKPLQGTRWCFTLNNWTEDEYTHVQSLECLFLIIGKEKGAEGTPHLQGYITFRLMKRLAAMKKLIPRAHFELARGTSADNIKYCSKDGHVWQKGTPPDESRLAGAKRGASVSADKYAAAFTLAKAGRFDEMDPSLFFRHYRTVLQIRKDYMKPPPDLDGVCGLWFWGPPRTGKSRRARYEYPDAYLKLQNKWWDGYVDQESVLLDDLDDNFLGHHLKIWADRYSFLAEIKGGALAIRPKRFIVTCNYSIADIFQAKCPILAAAIESRFTQVYFSEPWEPPAAPAAPTLRYVSPSPAPAHHVPRLPPVPFLSPDDDSQSDYVIPLPDSGSSDSSPSSRASSSARSLSSSSSRSPSPAPRHRLSVVPRHRFPPRIAAHPAFSSSPPSVASSVLSSSAVASQTYFRISESPQHT